MYEKLDKDGYVIIDYEYMKKNNQDVKCDHFNDNDMWKFLKYCFDDEITIEDFKWAFFYLSYKDKIDQFLFTRRNGSSYVTYKGETYERLINAGKKIIKANKCDFTFCY